MVKTTVETDLMKTRSSAVRLGPSRAGQGEGLQNENGRLDLDLSPSIWVGQPLFPWKQGHLTAESPAQWPRETPTLTP